MKRQHPYDEKCTCRRCQAVKRLLVPIDFKGRAEIKMFHTTFTRWGGKRIK